MGTGKISRTCSQNHALEVRSNASTAISSAAVDVVALFFGDASAALAVAKLRTAAFGFEFIFGEKVQSALIVVVDGICFFFIVGSCRRFLFPTGMNTRTHAVI